MVTEKRYSYSGDDDVQCVDGYSLDCNYDVFLSEIKIGDIIMMLFNLYDGKKSMVECEQMLDNMYVRIEKTTITR